MKIEYFPPALMVQLETENHRECRMWRNGNPNLDDNKLWSD